MGTEKNAGKSRVDEFERGEAEEEWEAERRRAADWERAKEAILAGTAVIA